MAAQVSAILLAAGASQRMGAPKALLPLGSRPAVRICAENIFGGGASEIIVVTGPDSQAIEQALSGLPVRFVRNSAKGSQMADSVRAGLGQVSSCASAVLVGLCDHPLVRQETIHCLLSAHEADPDRIVVPVFQGRKGHPTVFPLRILQEIRATETMRDIIGKDRSRVLLLSVEDEGVALDMDTPADYERMRSRLP